MSRVAHRRLPRVIAHRGASASRPENTIAAFDAALDEGCDGIELDLQLTRDGVPVVYHNRTLHKIGGGRHAVRQREWDEIRTLDAGGWLDRRYKAQRVPTLDDVLERYGRRTQLLLEIKVRPQDKRAGTHARLAELVAQHVRARRLQRRVMILCFDLDTLQMVAGGLRTVLNLKVPSRMTRSLDKAISHVWALSVDVRTISPQIVAAIHNRSTPVLAYTCNSSKTVQRALLAGADGFMSDRPGWLRAELKNAGRAVRSRPGQ